MPSAPPPKPEPISQARLALLLGTLTACVPMSIDMYLPAFPGIVGEFGAPEGRVQWTLAGFLLGASLAQLVYGPLSDRFGRRAPLFAGCGIFMLGSLGCAWAPSVEWLIGARLLQALGGAAGLVISRAVVRDLFKEREAARMFSLLMLVMGLAPILAPMAGSLLLQHGGWRGIFHVLSGFGFACLVAAYAWLPETLPPGRRSGGVRGVTWRHYRHLLGHRAFMGYALVSGFVSGCLFSYISGAPFVFIELHGISERGFAAFFGVNAMGMIGAAQYNRLLLRRRSPETILGRALLVNAGCALVLAAGIETGWGGLPAMAVLLFICLSSIGFTYPNIAAAALAPFGDMAGAASAMLGTVQFLIGGLCGGLVGLFNDHTALPMGGMVAFSALAAVLAMFGLARPPAVAGRT